jgi:protein-tyrosine phosphatase
MEFEKIHNFRDVAELAGSLAGGGLVVPARLYRSACLTSATGKDLDTLQHLGIRTIFDLRSPWEKDAFGATKVEGVRTIAIPLLDEFDEQTLTHCVSLEEGYLDLCTRGAIWFKVAKILTRLTSSSVLPAVVMCSAGKDRTGITVATLLLLLGAEPANIVADFARSAESLDALYGEWASNPASSITQAISLGRPNLYVHADAILSVCDWLRSKPSIEAFLSTYGATDGSGQKLRKALVVQRLRGG